MESSKDGGSCSWRWQQMVVAAVEKQQMVVTAVEKQQMVVAAVEKQQNDGGGCS